MKIRILLAVAIVSQLAACQTIDEAATSKAAAVCAEGGHGPGTTYYDYCVTSLKPVAADVERRRRAAQFDAGLANLATGLGRSPSPRIVCIQTGFVVQCY